jgi:hypothetical protein
MQLQNVRVFFTRAAERVLNGCCVLETRMQNWYVLMKLILSSAISRVFVFVLLSAVASVSDLTVGSAWCQADVYPVF